MLTRPTPLRSLALAGVLLAGGARLAAQLSSSSPFMPPANSAGAPTQNAPIEFRAVIETTEGVQYRIADPSKKNGGGVWVKMNERNPELGVTVKQYNPDKETVVVDHEGRTLTLELRKSKIISTGPAAQVMVPPTVPGAAQPNMLPAVTQTVVPNPTPADEQKRLEAVAQEVARRRALREQASTALNQGVAPQPNVAQPQATPGVLPANNAAPTAGPRRGPASDTRQR